MDGVSPSLFVSLCLYFRKKNKDGPGSTNHSWLKMKPGARNDERMKGAKEEREGGSEGKEGQKEKLKQTKIRHCPLRVL